MRTLPYNLTEAELVPESITMDKLDGGCLPTLRELILEMIDRRLSVDEQRRIFEAGLALHGEICKMDIFQQYDRVTLLCVALDTALVWELG